MVDAMIETGMRDADYVYLMFDDCWQVDRDEEGNIVRDLECFPSGGEGAGLLRAFERTEVRHLFRRHRDDLPEAAGEPGQKFQGARQYAA